MDYFIAGVRRGNGGLRGKRDSTIVYTLFEKMLPVKTDVPNIVDDLLILMLDHYHSLSPKSNTR